jgi:hypothetical protein
LRENEHFVRCGPALATLLRTDSRGTGTTNTCRLAMNRKYDQSLSIIARGEAGGLINIAPF